MYKPKLIDWMNRKENKLHILINNAGVSTSSRSETLSPTDEKKIMCPPYSETKQGFEIQFAVHLSPSPLLPFRSLTSSDKLPLPLSPHHAPTPHSPLNNHQLSPINYPSNQHLLRRAFQTRAPNLLSLLTILSKPKGSINMDKLRKLQALPSPTLEILGSPLRR
jgi:hypothetical protein